jgi:hypothetical protein
LFEKFQRLSFSSILCGGISLLATWSAAPSSPPGSWEKAMPPLFILAAANTLVAIYIFTLAPEYLLRARDYLCGRRGTGDGE